MAEEKYHPSDDFKVLKTYRFKSDYKPSYTWLKNLTNKKYQDDKLIKDMSKYMTHSDDGVSKTYGVDFDDIPNSQIIYKENNVNSPDGYQIYKPSSFVNNFNN